MNANNVHWSDERTVLASLTLPLTIDPESGFIFDAGMRHVAEMRGWSWISKLPYPEEFQDVLSQMVVDALNAWWGEPGETLRNMPALVTDLSRKVAQLEAEIARRDSHGPEGQNVTNAQHLALRDRYITVQAAWDQVESQLQRDCDLGMGHKSRRGLFLMQEHPDCDAPFDLDQLDKLKG